MTHLSPVREFIERDDGWWDVRIALEKAIGFFQQPLSSTSAWSSASRDFTRAATFADIATKLAALPDAPDHVESREVTPIEVDGRLEGRLGHGDWLMPRELDRFSAGGLNDQVSFTLEERSSVEIVMDCNSPFCRSHLTLVDAQGGSIDSNSGSAAEIRHTLEPGNYLIWAGTSAGFIGFYTLTLSLV